MTLVMFDVGRALERGYAVVVQDTRGRFASEGSFRPFRPDIEDGYDTIDWISTQPLCDGRVVMAGSSYLGATCWLAAMSAHPALKAIAPALTASDYYEGWIYQGGAFQLAFNLFWALVHLAPEERRRRELDEWGPATPVHRRTGAGEQDAAWSAAQESLAVAGGWLDHRPLGDVDALRDVADFYFAWLENDDRGAPYWEAISPERNAHAIGCPVLSISGWYQLFLRGAYEGLGAVASSGATELAREQSAMVIGPWENSVPSPRNTKAGEVDFGAQAGLDFEALQLDFFDSVLERATPETVRVRYFTMGRNEWRSAAEWPPRGTVSTALFAGTDGRLTEARSSDTEAAFDETRFDPARPAPTLGGNTVPGLPQGPRDHRDLLDRPDVVVYWTDPLSQSTEITGPVSAVVQLVSTAETVDVVVALAYEAGDGRLLNICDGITRVSQAQSEQAVTIDLLATSIEVPAGARLCMLVHHSNFPRFDVNPGVLDATRLGRAEVPSTQKIFRTATRATRIMVPIVPAA